MQPLFWIILEQGLRRQIKDPQECREILINTIKEQMDVKETAYDFENKKSIILVMGVNGVVKPHCR